MKTRLAIKQKTQFIDEIRFLNYCIFSFTYVDEIKLLIVAIIADFLKNVLRQLRMKTSFYFKTLIIKCKTAEELLFK